MKQAKRVEIPDDRKITSSQYEKLLQHAERSAEWHILNYNRNERELRERLLRKGYIEGNVIVASNDDGAAAIEHNIVDEAISFLKENNILDDERSLEELVYGLLASGKSTTTVKTRAIQRRYDMDDIDKAILAYKERYGNEDELSGLESAAEHIASSSSFMTLGSVQKRKQKVIRSLVSKGYRMGDIFEWMNQHEEVFYEGGKD